ncbi:MAG: hypothetical protein IKP68_09350, partial [Clostridia bacterium]|nr:hypothetical protein [Clostridia bacterium]
MEKTNIDDSIFRFIYIMAMQDAVRQSAYSGERKWLWSKPIFEILYKPLKNHIDSILNGDYKPQSDDDGKKESYDKAFIGLAIEILSKINEEEKGKKKRERAEGNDTEKYKYKGTFKFGNAQKLINMTVKYFYVMTYGNNNISRDHFQYCHCPVDGQMLKKVWKKRSSEIMEKMKG